MQCCPTKMKSGNRANQVRGAQRQHRNAGFTLLEIMIVVAIIAILLAIIIPSSVQARTRSQRHVCISHLRQISSAIQQWALETKLFRPDPMAE